MGTSIKGSLDIVGILRSQGFSMHRTAFFEGGLHMIRPWLPAYVHVSYMRFDSYRRWKC